MKDIIIIDNQLLSFYSCLTNSILVESFYGDSEDIALKSLIPFLLNLEKVTDVRNELEKEFDLPGIYQNYIKAKKLFPKLIKSSCKLT